MTGLAGEALTALATGLVTGVFALVVQLWRLSDRLARVDERLAKSLECCARLDHEQEQAARLCAEHGRVLARAGLL